MREKILEDLKQAMKDQNKELLAVIRMVKGAIQMEELNTKKELSDDEVISIISKQIKTRKESIAEFQKGGRDDLVAKTNDEIAILEKYMPQQLSDDEVLDIINLAFETIKPNSIKDMGRLMTEVRPKLNGRYDMSKVSQIIKEKLAK